MHRLLPDAHNGAWYSEIAVMTEQCVSGASSLSHRESRQAFAGEDTSATLAVSWYKERVEWTTQCSATPHSTGKLDEMTR